MSDEKSPLTHDSLDLQPVDGNEDHKPLRAWVTPNDFAIVGCSCGDERGGRAHFRHLAEVGGYPDHRLS